MPAIVRITDDSTDAELCEAIGYLRTRQLRAETEGVREEIQVGIDALLDQLSR